jgi:hypothetical protein
LALVGPAFRSQGVGDLVDDGELVESASTSFHLVDPALGFARAVGEELL